MNVLLIFVKNPVAGNVKTRLAATIGNQKALEVYLKLLSITKNAAINVDADRRVWYSAAVEEEDEWPPDKFSKFRQEGNNLGERMAAAFKHAFEDGAGKVVIIGSDCPAITADHIEQAYKKLDRSDTVIGPSADGGYYLLGMNRFLPGLFSGINWSTPGVLGQTKGIISRAGLSCVELEQLNDIDTAEDLEKDMILSAGK